MVKKQMGNVKKSSFEAKVEPKVAKLLIYIKLKTRYLAVTGFQEVTMKHTERETKVSV